MSTEDFDKEKVLRRIKKLLAMADPNSGATEGERDNALRMAHATLAKYNLSMSQVDATGAKPQDEKRTGSPISGRDYPWMRTTAAAIARLMFCEYFFIRMRGGKVQHFFVGRETNVLSAQALTQYVISSIDREALRMEGERTGQRAGSTYWRSFCKGAAGRVWTRCDNLRSEAERASAAEAKQLAHTPGTALVLASVYEQEQKANIAFMEQSMGITDLKVSNTRQRNTDWSAAHDGARYGDKINLTPVPTGSDNKRLK